MSQHEIAEKAADEQPPQKPRKREPRETSLSQLALLIGVVGLVGALVWDLTLQKPEKPGMEHNALLGITIFTQAMIAFFGILNLNDSHTKKVSPLTKGGMRTAITGAFVVAYLFLVIFHTMVQFLAGSSGTSSTADSFVKSFTTLVGFIIFFYFASEATIHWINRSKPNG